MKEEASIEKFKETRASSLKKSAVWRGKQGE